MLKKSFGNKKVVKGFTLVEIIVVLVILAVLAAATIPSMLGFVDNAKKKVLSSEARAVYTAAQAYATEHYAQGMGDDEIINNIKGAISSSKLHNLLQNDATGIIIGDGEEAVKVENGKVTRLTYTKDGKFGVKFENGGIDFCKLDGSALPATSTLVNASSTVADLTLAELKTEIINSVYPVGAYYTSHDSTSPETLFGGTWSRVENKFLYCIADNANKPEDSSVALSVGGTGGTLTHTHTTGDWTLTIQQIPSHSHVRDIADNLAGGSAGAATGLWTPAPKGYGNVTASTTSTGDTGGGQAHNHGNTGSTSNIPPYVAVYCWRRTA